LLGTEKATVADIMTSTLWSTMTDRFPAIAAMLDEAAPRTAALSRRLQEVPSLKALKEDSDARYGESYCGGDRNTVAQGHGEGGLIQHTQSAAMPSTASSGVWLNSTGLPASP
jgi:hypothetical protein